MNETLTLPSKWVQFKVNNDQQAKEELIVSHISLVKYVAERIKDNLPPEVEREDLVSYGVFGLIDAIEKFDHNRGIKFETYAIPRIRGAILDGLRSYDTASRTMRQKAKKLGKAFADVENRLGRCATDKEVAEELQMDMDSYNTLLSEVGRLHLLSLDEVVIHDDDSSVTLGERLEDKSSLNPALVTELNETRDSLIRGIESLTEQERIVVALYFYDELNLREISEVLDLSESRISQIRAKAIVKLRNKLANLEID
jgi:RNA polymerase sigma factor for flagellar operon FliA